MLRRRVDPVSAGICRSCGRYAAPDAGGLCASCEPVECTCANPIQGSGRLNDHECATCRRLLPLWVIEAASADVRSSSVERAHR